MTLLRSALARPLNHLAYQSSDIIELAAKYIAGLVRNHPFIDGNQRTGFVVGVLFLELNGCRFVASEEAAAQMVLELAAGSTMRRFSVLGISRLSRPSELLEAHTTEDLPEVSIRFPSGTR